MSNGALTNELINSIKTITPYRFEKGATKIIKQSFVPNKKSDTYQFPAVFWHRTSCFYERGYGHYDNTRGERTIGAVGFFISDYRSKMSGHRSAILKILNALPMRKNFGYFKNCRGQSGKHIFYGRIYYEKDFVGKFPRQEMNKDLVWLVHQTLPSFAAL